MKRFQPVKFVLCAGLLAIAACSPKVENHGYMKQGDIKEKLVIGQTTKDEVLTALGSPSAQSSFGEEAWYYITSRREATAFFKPKVTEQDVVRIDFDSAGVVSKVETYNKDNAKVVDMVKRTTPTEGHSMGIMEQFLGNLGRFNSPGGGMPGGHSIPGGH